MIISYEGGVVSAESPRACVSGHAISPLLWPVCGRSEGWETKQHEAARVSPRISDVTIAAARVWVSLADGPDPARQAAQLARRVWWDACVRPEGACGWPISRLGQRCDRAPGKPEAQEKSRP